MRREERSSFLQYAVPLSLQGGLSGQSGQTGGDLEGCSQGSMQTRIDKWLEMSQK